MTEKEKSVKLVRHVYTSCLGDYEVLGNTFHSKKTLAAVCLRGLRELFDLHVDTRTVWAVLSKTPHPQAHKIVEVDPYEGLLFFKWGKKPKRIDTVRRVTRIVERYGVPCYVRLEVEDTKCS